MSVCKVYQKSLSCRPILTTHVDLLGYICTYMCVCACIDGCAISRGESGDDSFLACLGDPPRCANFIGRARFSRYTCTWHVTRLGERPKPVLESLPSSFQNDQCVRSSSLNIRDTLVAIREKKNRTLRTRSFCECLASIFSGVAVGASTLRANHGSVCELIVDRYIIN